MLVTPSNIHIVDHPESSSIQRPAISHKLSSLSSPSESRPQYNRKKRSLTKALFTDERMHPEHARVLRDRDGSDIKEGETNLKQSLIKNSMNHNSLIA